MQAGLMRNKVEIQRYVETQDSMGEPIKGYEHFAYMWASIQPMLGREVYAEKMVSSEQTHKINMRYLADVESTMRIVWNGRIFELIGPPINYQERSIFYTFNVKELYDHDTVHPVP